MLTCHPQISIPPESAFIIWWKEKYSDWSADISEQKINEFIDDLFSSSKFEFWGMSRSALSEAIFIQNASNYANLMALIYILYAKKIGKSELRYWGDKNNYYVGFIDELYTLFPDARFIQIVRDARDVATSYTSLQAEKGKSQYYPNLPHDLKKIAIEWNENNSKIHRSFQVIPNEQKYIIRYEDLVMEPQKRMMAICEFLGLDYSQKMLEYYKYNQKYYIEPEEFKAWKSKTFQPIDSNEVKKYTTLLSVEEQAVIETWASESLKRYKYL